MWFQLMIPFILLLAVASAPAGAAVRIGEAQVRDGSNGTPCFTISEREERRAGAPNFKAVTVYDPSRTPKATMWTMAMPPTRTFPVSFSMCIPYAGRLRALPQTAAVALETGKVYQVVINAHVAGAADAPHGYASRFCLLRQGDGSIAVRQIDADAREGRYRYGCILPR
jgi:hypothetical protein